MFLTPPVNAGSATELGGVGVAGFPASSGERYPSALACSLARAIGASIKTCLKRPRNLVCRGFDPVKQRPGIEMEMEKHTYVHASGSSRLVGRRLEQGRPRGKLGVELLDGAVQSAEKFRRE